ncbi:MAG: 16S rRNA (adenine(1518)-N(6)/adenine(1519)-N(6))-dimethyltransferase RsmA [Candidatus Obscuribacterales bacterium]|nr:16S rRNA (adenine(1518)-N(6)/adenine(1519)-N(6))-dimethyltransferase RsmA [Candidatus Obscuribacterales bacterium]
MNVDPNSEQLLKSARTFQTKKRLGQNFLVDASVLDLIVESLDLKPGDQVVEIGPGIGFLTRLLSNKQAEIRAVDLDRQCIQELESLRLPGVVTHHGDFLQYDLLQSGFSDKFKAVGNVPYQITGLILHHLLGEIGEPSNWIANLKTIVLTVQREVAWRMVAPAGSEHYSQVSLLVQYFCQSELITTIKPESFYPRPAVNSAIVKLTPHQHCPIECNDKRFLRRVIKAGFAQRRKMLRKALTSLNLQSIDIDAVFRENKIDPQARAENLSLAQFAKLTDALSDQMKCKP